MNCYLNPLLLVSASLLAQSWPARPVRGHDPGMMEGIQQMQTERLKHHLGIPEEKAKALANRWSRWIWEASAQGRKTRQLRGQLEDILRGPGSEEDKNARVKPVLDQFLVARQHQADSRRVFEEEIRTGLTPAQQARLIGMIDEFQRQLQEGMRQAVRQGRMGRER